MIKERYQAVLQQVNTPENDPPPYPLMMRGSVVLGRDPTCHIVLDPAQYRTVSRRHAEVLPVPAGETPEGYRLWQVCDMGSANGTYVNGARIRQCQVLRQGDRLMLGLDGPEFVFDYQVGGTPKSRDTIVVDSSINLPQRSTSRSELVRPTARVNSTPHEHDSVSLTQLFPIFSTGKELTHKAYLLPGGITVAFVVLLFLSVGRPAVFNLLIAAYLSGAAYYFVYRLCGKRKPWWLLAGSAVTIILLLLSPALEWFIFLFRQVLPGNIPPENAASLGFPVLLVRMFFGAGLMEELMKAVPIFLAYFLGTQIRRSPYREEVGVWEPLDGILLGAAAAVGFTLVETLGQYMPEVYQSTIKAGESAAQLASLQLLIPRVLGMVSGHMAYSGYFGYFIGLSAMRRRKRWLILTVGYLTASVLHALWNTAGEFSPVLLLVVGVLSYAFLTAAILKARELSPVRSQNFATRLK